MADVGLYGSTSFAYNTSLDVENPYLISDAQMTTGTSLLSSSVGSTATGATASSGTNWSAVGAGITLGAGIGNFLGSFAQGKAQAATYKLQGQMAWLNAQSEAQALQQNALNVSHAAGQQEYAMYQQQKSHRATMETNLAANGVALEGSAVDIMAEQAKVDAKNRDAIIDQSKSEQSSLNLQAQQKIQEGKNAVAYANAMAKAANKTAWVSGLSGLIGAAGSAAGMYGSYYARTA